MKEFERILIVEDDLIIGKYLALYLEDIGYKIVGLCKSAEKALKKLEEKEVDLILMDIRIKGELDGIELAKIINELYGTPLIYLTAYADDATLDRAKRTKNYGYLLKPYNDQILKVTLQMAEEKIRTDRTISHLNRVLNAIKNISFLLKKETRIEELVQNACNALTVSNTYSQVWIAAKNFYGDYLYTGTSGFEGEEELKEYLKQSNLPNCKNIAANNETNLLNSPSTCENCALKKFYPDAPRIALKIEYRGILYGIIHVTLVPNLEPNEEEVELLKELAGNIAYTIYTIFQEKAREEAEAREKEKEKQLEHSNRLVSLGFLSAGIAHEIANPNNFIMLNTPMLEKLFDGALPILDNHFLGREEQLISGIPYASFKKQLPKLFNGIMLGSEKIKHIVNELKDFAVRDEPEELLPVNIHEVIEGAGIILANLIKKSTTAFSVQLDRIPEISGNKRRLEQVFINLIQNACQALTSPSQSITITGKYDKQNQKAVITISDQGEGIQPDNLEHIKDPFFTTKRSSGGTGLGLSISASIIDQHKGTLLFSSKPGKGTDVRIELPVKK